MSSTLHPIRLRRRPLLAAPLLVAVSLALSAPAGAAVQAPERGEPNAALSEHVWLGPVAVGDRAREVLVGIGPDYSAEFERGLRFAPRGAEGAAGTLALELGGEVLFRAEGVREPRATGQRVSYALGPWGEERFTVRPDGIKHDVVLEELPERRGELVVRMALDAPGAVASAADGSRLAFGGPGGRGTRIGEVVIVDAEGRRTTGRLACEGDTLTYTVAADFVERAALPLVVDPLIAADFHYGSTAPGKSSSPDVAYSEHLDGYGVVWQRSTPSGLQLVNFTCTWSIGSQAVATMVLGSTANEVVPPRIADIWEGRMFVVVWGEHVGTRTLLHARVLEADDPSGPWFQDFAADIVEPRFVDFDLGGGTAREALLAVAWESSGTLIGRGLQPVLDPEEFEGLEEGQTIYFTPRVLLNSGVGEGDELHDQRVSVSRSDPWAVVWERHFPDGNVDVYGTVFAPGRVSGPEQPLFDDPGRREELPSIAGEDGVLAVTAHSNDGVFEEILAQPLELGGGCPWGTLCLPSPPVLVDIWPLGTGLQAASVGTAGSSTFVVSWTRPAGGGLWQVVAAEFDAAGFTVCDPEFDVAQTIWPTVPRLSDDFSASLGCLVVWAGWHSAYSEPETRAAMIQACAP